MFSIFIVFCLWFAIESSKHSKESQQKYQDFLRREHEAALTRKKDISNIPKIKIPDDLPFKKSNDASTNSIQNDIRKLHNVETFLTKPMSLGKLDQLIQMFKSKDIFSAELEKQVMAYNQLADDDYQLKYMLLPVLNQFDGTIESIGHVARTFVKGLKTCLRPL